MSIYFTSFFMWHSRLCQYTVFTSDFLCGTHFCVNLLHPSIYFTSFFMWHSHLCQYTVFTSDFLCGTHFCVNLLSQSTSPINLLHIIFYVTLAFMSIYGVHIRFLMWHTLLCQSTVTIYFTHQSTSHQLLHLALT